MLIQFAPTSNVSEQCLNLFIPITICNTKNAFLVYAHNFELRTLETKMFQYFNLRSYLFFLSPIINPI